MTTRLILVLLALAVLACSPAPETPAAAPSATPISTLAPGEIAMGFGPVFHVHAVP